jgi:protein transport protein SEC24
MDYIFAFDVSREAIYSEFLSSACETLKLILFGGTDAGGSHLSTIPESSRICILTFDTTLHFYDFSVRHPPSLITS